MPACAVHSATCFTPHHPQVTEAITVIAIITVNVAVFYRGKKNQFVNIFNAILHVPTRWHYYTCQYILNQYVGGVHWIHKLKQILSV
jgi:hypothetical protein